MTYVERLHCAFSFCATDMWDEWEEDPDNYYTNRHQRRLSDPSANLNNFSRHGWKAKATAAATAAAGGGGENVGSSAANDRFAGKARSQNEGLDSIANELSEVEAGDLRDGELMKIQKKTGAKK